MDTGGIYYGENAISGKLILCSLAKLLNPSVIVLGVPGSGKSFSAKELTAFLTLATDDDNLQHGAGICTARQSSESGNHTDRRRQRRPYQCAV